MYTFDKTLPDTSFDAAVNRTKESLVANGFGVLTEIDVRKTMKAKLDTDIGDYLILGACNPQMAFEALKLEPRVGTMLPCNVIIRQVGDNSVEVSAIDPVASMTSIENPDLHDVARKVRDMLKSVIDAL